MRFSQPQISQSMVTRLDKTVICLVSITHNHENIFYAFGPPNTTVNFTMLSASNFEKMSLMKTFVCLTISKRKIILYEEVKKDRSDSYQIICKKISELADILYQSW